MASCENKAATDHDMGVNTVLICISFEAALIWDNRTNVIGCKECSQFMVKWGGGWHEIL